MVTTTQSPTRLVPGESSIRATSSVASLRAIGFIRRVQLSILAHGKRNLAAIAARVRKHGREQVRQVDLGVDLLHDLAVAFHSDVEFRPGQRGLPSHRLLWLFRLLRPLSRLRALSWLRPLRRLRFLRRLRPLRNRRLARTWRGWRRRCWNGTRGDRRGSQRRCLRVGRGLRFGVDLLLRGFRFFLNLRRADSEALDDAEEALVDFAADALTLLRRHLLERAALRHLAKQLASDRRQVDLHVRRIDGRSRCGGRRSAALPGGKRRIGGRPGRTRAVGAGAASATLSVALTS